MSSSNPPINARVPGTVTRARMRSALSVSALVLGLTIAPAACARSESAGAPADSCASLVRSGAFAQERDAEVRDLDQAIKTCPSYDAFVTELSQYQQAVGYSVKDFVKLRCRTAAETLGDTAVCATAVPATTVAEASIAPYVGETLDGIRVSVTPDEVEFTGDVPTVIQQTVDIGTTGGCIGVIGQRDDYAGMAVALAGTRAGEIASMYAQHAQAVADYLRCVSVPLTSTPPGATTEPPKKK